MPRGCVQLQGRRPRPRLVRPGHSLFSYHRLRWPDGSQGGVGGVGGRRRAGRLGAPGLWRRGGEAARAQDEPRTGPFTPDRSRPSASGGGRGHRRAWPPWRRPIPPPAITTATARSARRRSCASPRANSPPSTSSGPRPPVRWRRRTPWPRRRPPATCALRRRAPESASTTSSGRSSTDPSTRRAPAMLLFDERDGPDRAEPAVGFSYWLRSDGEPAGFAGPNDRWHQHHGICVVNGFVDREGAAEPGGLRRRLLRRRRPLDARTPGWSPAGRTAGGRSPP